MITEKRWIEHPSVIYTIFSKYLALPIATFPIYLRVKSATIRYLPSRHEGTLPIKLLTLINFLKFFSGYYDLNITIPQPKWDA